jgi:hypothetical protein
MKTTSSLLLLLSFALGLAACTSVVSSNNGYQTETPSESATETSSVITEERLENMTYRGIYDEPVTLADGLYEGAPFVDNAASKPTLTLLRRTAYGDLNGDGAGDAALLLIENSGGSGSFLYLAAVLDSGGVPENVATKLLGDRVRPDAVAIVNSEIIVEVTSHSEDDPLCCPSLRTRTVYALVDEGIAIVRTESITKSRPIATGPVAFSLSMAMDSPLLPAP